MTIEDIERFGADTKAGLGRCMGNGDFYIRLFKMMPNDQNFGLLFAAADKGDLDGAFEAAHALKGALGNLSITCLYEPMCKLTEILRPRTPVDCSALVGEIRAKYDELVKLCES